MNRAAAATMRAGLALNVATAIVPFIDQATGHVLADHIRAGYPTYSTQRIDSAVTAYIVILTIVAVLGVIGWFTAIRALAAAKWWTRWAATAFFLLGVTAGLCGLLVKDTSGEVGLAPLLGWVMVLPCLPGLVSVVLLWRDGTRADR